MKREEQAIERLDAELAQLWAGEEPVDTYRMAQREGTRRWQERHRAEANRRSREYQRRKHGYYERHPEEDTA